MEINYLWLRETVTMGGYSSCKVPDFLLIHQKKIHLDSVIFSTNTSLFLSI